MLLLAKAIRAPRKWMAASEGVWFYNSNATGDWMIAGVKTITTLESTFPRSYLAGSTGNWNRIYGCVAEGSQVASIIAP